METRELEERGGRRAAPRCSEASSAAGSAAKPLPETGLAATRERAAEVFSFRERARSQGERAEGGAGATVAAAVVAAAATAIKLARALTCVVAAAAAAAAALPRPWLREEEDERRASAPLVASKVIETAEEDISSSSSGSGANREAEVRRERGPPLSPPPPPPTLRDSLAAADRSSRDAVAGRIALPATACSFSQASEGSPERRTSNVAVVVDVVRGADEEETETAAIPGGGLATGHSGALLHAPSPGS